MLRFVSALIIALAVAVPAAAQDRSAAAQDRPAAAQDRPAAGVNREQSAPGAAGPKDSGVVQRGAQPNPAEVRPGNRDGDAPSAAAGELVTRSGRRILGLPVDTALILAGVLIVLAVIAGVLIPGARRRDRARGGGTYGSNGRFR